MEAKRQEGIPTRCVMLAERGTSPPPALLEALRRHAIEPLRCESPFIAFARLCEFGAKSPDAPVALLLVQPERLPEGEALRTASERYTPGVTCWVYDETSRPRLRAAAPLRTRVETPARHEPAGQARLSKPAPPARPRPAPRLRLVEADAPDLGIVDPGQDLTQGANQGAPASVGPNTGAPTSPRSILTDDELEMLMAPELPDD